MENISTVSYMHSYLFWCVRFQYFCQVWKIQPQIGPSVLSLRSVKKKITSQGKNNYIINTELLKGLTPIQAHCVLYLELEIDFLEATQSKNWERGLDISFLLKWLLHQPFNEHAHNWILWVQFKLQVGGVSFWRRSYPLRPLLILSPSADTGIFCGGYWEAKALLPNFYGHTDKQLGGRAYWGTSQYN